MQMQRKSKAGENGVNSPVVLTLLLLSMVMVAIIFRSGAGNQDVLALMEVSTSFQGAESEPDVAPEGDLRLRGTVERGAPRLDGLQTLAMQRAMVQSCPADTRLRVTPTMKYEEEFVPEVARVLNFTVTKEDPYVYVASHFAELVEKRGILSKDAVWAEFGVWKGATLKQTHKILSEQASEASSGLTLAGFDSFRGLPVEWRKGFKRGHFGTAFEAVRADVPKDIALYPGWFQDSIGVFMEEYPKAPLSMLNHDGDLYLSTSITFSILNERIVPGTILCFDEIFGYEGFKDHEILSLFVWMKERNPVLCPLSVMGPYSPEDAISKNLAQDKQGACFQVLSLPELSWS